MAQPTTLLMSLLTIVLSLSGVISTTFTFANTCDYTVWLGILSNSDAPPLSTTGFTLQSGKSKSVTAPTSWGGRFWGRTLCSQDSSGYFSCATGDCGSNKIECSGNGATPPVTLAEFKLDDSSGLGLFHVSLVDGYNLPLLVVPQGGTGQNCTTTGCVADLNNSCPTELKVTTADGKNSVACKSACAAFNQPEYCCSGAYTAPDTCMPSMYSQMFKSACPYAASYAYDDKTSTFTCASADYTIIFCPSSPTPNSNTGQNSPPGQNSPQGQNGQTPTGRTRSPSTNKPQRALKASRVSLVCVSVFVVTVATTAVAVLVVILLKKDPTSNCNCNCNSNSTCIHIMQPPPPCKKDNDCSPPCKKDNDCSPPCKKDNCCKQDNCCSPPPPCKQDNCCSPPPPCKQDNDCSHPCKQDNDCSHPGECIIS